MTDLEIVQEARIATDANIVRLRQDKESWSVAMEKSAFYGGLTSYQKLIKYLDDQLNSWLAHKAFFERHKRLETYAGDLCEVCEYSEYRASYPCPESVAQAKAILGVTE